MATRDLAALLPLAESIADGSPIDWAAAEARASHDDQAIIRQLRILANLAVLHRSLPSDPAAQSAPAAVTHRGATAPAIGSWAHLALVERLGGGTFGEVYRAWDRHLEREVALKLLRATEASDNDLPASRIAAEGRLLARVHHQNVITVHGVAVHEQRVGLWMELVRGATLEQLLQKRGPFSAREAALVGIDLCRALAAIHAAGLVHRDVKAQNVMREDGGRIVLMDLGTGREIDRTREHALPDLAGTPLYLAPEIFDGVPASERTDLYSLGVLLYHLVTGSFPTRATTIEELRDGHAKGTGVRLRDARADLPTAFVTVVDRAIAHDPNRRYASAGALEADLVRALDDTTVLHAPAATPAPAAADETAPARPSAWRRPRIIAALAAAVVVLAVLGWPALRSRWTPATAPGTIRSIAVLPLRNISGDASQDYFADAMTDELIGTLGQLHGVTVKSRTSSMQFKGSRKLVPEIARLLEADAVLEGTVLITPGSPQEPSGQKHVRIHASLIQAGTDTSMLELEFEKVLTDVITLQRMVAAKVADGIHLQITPNLRLELAGTGTQNPAAQDAYLRGRSYLDNSAQDRLKQARQSLEESVGLDPNYARAHAALAVCYVWLEQLGVLPHAEAHMLATTAANRALQLDANLPEAHAALADVEFFYDWDWSGAEVEYRRALDLNPSYSWARVRYADYLAAAGRLSDALREAKRAEEIDPLSPDAKVAVGMMLYYDRQYDEAIGQFRRALELAPARTQERVGLARGYSAKGAFVDAIREANEAIRLSGDSPVYIAELARIYAAGGRQDDARAQLARLEQMASASQTSIAPQALANIYAALGENDRAFQLLDRSVNEHRGMLWARVDPRLEGLHQDRRWTALLLRIGPPTSR